MGRPRKILDAKADLKAVRARLKDKGLEGWERQRLQAAQMGLGGEYSLPEIAERVGVSARTVGHWFEALRKGGIAGLLQRSKGNGPESWLNEETAVLMKAELEKGHWRRAEDARVWLEKKLGRKLTLVVTYKYLGKCEARLKVPRPVHRKKDPAKVEAFRRELCQKLHREEIPLESRVHLWVTDEMRFGLQPVTRRVWTRRGVEVVVPMEPRFQWGYTYGALEVGGDGAQFFHTDGVSLEASRCFLEQVGQSSPQAMHIVIQDGAGFHLKEKDPNLPANVRVITLPAYSPELNPVEKLWDVIKDRLCNKAWDDLDALVLAINSVLHEYWSDPRKVRSLIGQGYLLDQLNTSYANVLAA